MRVSLYVHAALTVCTGAFLLFVVQPMVGKGLLPYFGGSYSVWTTSLVFFTGMLFAGYLYVYMLTRLQQKKQLLIHLALVSASLITILFARDYSDLTLYLAEHYPPALAVLAALLFSIGLPFFLLATTAPLVQYWYSRSGVGEPYTLYALSNAASFFALSYPFFVEPLFSLKHQRASWVALFSFYVVLIATFALRSRHNRPERRARSAYRGGIFRWEYFKWILLSALPAYLLVATTTSITKTIVPIPLLWVVPLALYLLTFIIAFAGWGRSFFVPLLFIASEFAAWRFTPGSYEEIVPQILSYLALLFFCSLYCNVLLYKTRPRVRTLPLFYVFLSLGGAMGVFMGSVLTVLVFEDYWDFTLGLALSSSLAIAALPKSFFPRILKTRHIFLSRVVSIAMVVVLFVRFVSPDDAAAGLSERNFYGTTKVSIQSGHISLMHGTTLHGMEFTDLADALLPTTYYTPDSGLGRAILFEQGIRGERDLGVGIIGLGVGTIAAYCESGDTFVFYELDARVERIARSHFSYLSHCHGAEVRIGDGRLSLANETRERTPQRYDVLAVDAFSDDTIPMHLLTLEAFAEYLAHLRAPESILAVHISNRYLDLAPIVFRAAAELRMNAMLAVDTGDLFPGGSPSTWVLLSGDPEVFRSVAFANANAYPSMPAARPWTDDYSSLISVLDIPTPWNP